VKEHATTLSLFLSLKGHKIVDDSKIFATSPKYFYKGIRIEILKREEE